MTTPKKALPAKAAPKYITQVLVTVRRGLTDSTPVLVYPWEVPILERIHGEGNVNEENTKETERWLRLTGVNQPSDTVKETHGGQIKTIPAYDPSIDIAAEYMRMVNKYGMDPDRPMPVVEFCYGLARSGQFEAAVLENIPEELRAGRVARILREGGADSLSGAEIRSALDQRKIVFKRTASLSTLRSLLNDALGEEIEAENEEREQAAA